MKTKDELKHYLDDLMEILDNLKTIIEQSRKNEDYDDLFYDDEIYVGSSSTILKAITNEIKRVKSEIDNWDTVNVFDKSKSYFTEINYELLKNLEHETSVLWRDGDKPSKNSFFPTNYILFREKKLSLTYQNIESKRSIHLTNEQFINIIKQACPKEEEYYVRDNTVKSLTAFITIYEGTNVIYYQQIGDTADHIKNKFTLKELKKLKGGIFLNDEVFELEKVE